MPVWLAAYVHGYALRGPLPALFWHGHEMVFGFGFAAVAGFLLTAIPNWTGRLPVRGDAAGRAGLAVACRPHRHAGPWQPRCSISRFRRALIVVVARELIAGRNWRNLPMLVALALLFSGNVLVHLHALGIAYARA